MQAVPQGLGITAADTGDDHMRLSRAYSGYEKEDGVQSLMQQHGLQCKMKCCSSKVTRHSHMALSKGSHATIQPSLPRTCISSAAMRARRFPNANSRQVSFFSHRLMTWMNAEAYASSSSRGVWSAVST